MYHTGIDPLTGRQVYVPRSEREKNLQKALLLFQLPEKRQMVIEALRVCGREEVAKELFGGRTEAGKSQNREGVKCAKRKRPIGR
jgi:Arc/MetJ family transcription regulator